MEVYKIQGFRRIDIEAHDKCEPIRDGFSYHIEDQLA